MMGAIKDEIVRQIVERLVDESDKMAAKQLRDVADILDKAGPSGKILGDYYRNQAKRIEKRVKS